ncbi:MAG: hypothetical protein ACPLN0_00995 [Candidatus Hydrothermia bacterium]
MNRRLFRKYSKYIIGAIILWALYQNFTALYDYISTSLTNKKYKSQLLHLKARLYTIMARNEYMKTKEGAQKVLENKLKELGN